MKKIFVFLVSLIAFCSCSQRSVSPSSHFNGPDCRFSVVYEQCSSLSGAIIILDSCTGNKYLFYKCGYAGGLTPLHD